MRSTPLAFVVLAACHSTTKATPTTDRPGDASVPSVVPPRAASEPSAIPGAAPTRGRALPSLERLVAPFRGTQARGFVAMVAIDGAQPRRVVAPLGAKNVDEDRPVLVASLTKLWTAVAALRLVERGELSLDATIKELLPELASRPWADSTLHELMSHTSRVPELGGDGIFRRPEVDFSSPLAELARSISRDVTEKRGVYKYRNAEYAIVGAILATTAKANASEVLAREVFGPARMRHSGLLVGKGPAPPGLDLVPLGPIRPQNFYTAGAGYASASDLLSFFEALAGSSLLDERSKAVLFAGVPERAHHALGCWAYPFAGPSGKPTRIVERPGSFGDVRLYTAFFPDEQRAIVAYTSDGSDIAKPHAERGIGPSLAHVAIE